MDEIITMPEHRHLCPSCRYDFSCGIYHRPWREAWAKVPLGRRLLIRLCPNVGEHKELAQKGA